MWRRTRCNLYLERKRRGRRRLFIVLSFLLAPLVALVLSVAPREQPSPKDYPTSLYPGRFTEKKELRQSVYTIIHSIKPGDTLYQILANHGVEVREVAELIGACKSLPELRKLKPGEIVKIFFSRDSQRLEKVRYQNTNGQVVALARANRGWISSKYTKPLVVILALAQGNIKESLYQSALDEKIDFELALSLADIFAWDIDFFVDLRPGDHYEFLYEQQYRDRNLVGNGRIIAAHFYNDSIHHRAYYYKVAGRGADYYDERGSSLCKQFLKSPLRYSRISSGFSKRRLHPILKIYRPHPGVDYAAPIGTPVVALGDGRVIFKGWKNGYGRFVAIRHNNRYTTTYGHLSRYASKVRVGSSVEQGQVIGYVGASGLATGPHLDFRMKKNGRFVNPLKVRFPAARPVPTSYMSDFKRRVGYLEAKLDHLLSQTNQQNRSPVSLAVSGNL